MLVRLSCLLALVATSLCGPVQSQEVIVDYSTLDPKFPGNMGPYRDENEDPEKQWIEAVNFERNQTGFLKLFYIVEGSETHNGHWWQYREAQDWRDHADRSLVLRLACGETCTPKFKVEVQTSDTPDAPQKRWQTFRKYLWAGNKKQVAEVHENGYTDISLPLSEFTADLTRIDGKFVKPVLTSKLQFVRQIVVVFENREAPEGRRTGELYINQIRID